MRSLDKIYGIIVTSDRNTQIEILSRLKESYHLTGFMKSLYRVSNDVIKKGLQIDLLSLCDAYKDRGIFTNEIAIKLSALTNNLGLTEIVSLDNLILDLENELSLRQADKLVNDIMIMKRDEKLNKNKFENLINNLEFNGVKKTTQSNTDIMFDILKDHDKAKVGDFQGTKLGYNCLDKTILLEDCDVMVVGARPAMGKTAWAISTMLELANQQKNVVFFGLEMSQKQIMRRVMGYLSEVDTNKIKYGEMNDSDLNDIHTSMQYDLLNHIKVIEGSKSINTITSDVLELNRSFKIDIVIIDYIQKIIPVSNRSRYEQVTEISNGVKLFCQNFKIPVIALAQLSRDSSRTGKRPSLPDLKESGEIEQDASIVSFLHRPEYYGEEQLITGESSLNRCEFITAKNREGSIGIKVMNIDLKISKFVG